jgi:hypothetical protein
MYSEPIEFTGLKRHHRSQAFVHGRRSRQTTDSAIVDEAFAALPLEMSDPVHVKGEWPNIRAAKNPSDGLFGHIAAEVAALNRRCADLSDMLCRLETPANESP